ncbi:MAG: xanthine dehydrogenase family protein molybdopterin-binding subunit [Geminicoccales bacterium]
MLEFRKDLFADERDDNLIEIGQPTQRQDMIGHVTGRTRYFDDHAFEGLLHLKCLRSPHHHARIRSIDTSAAERASGVRRIVRAADVPVNLNTLLSLLQFGKDDEPSLADDEVRYIGEPVIAVIADSEREARAALALVRVDYEVLQHILDVEDAIKPGAMPVNPTYPENTFTYHETYNRQQLRYGDVEAGFRGADHVLEERYQMSPIEHAPTETNGAIAAPESNGRFVCYTSTQALFFSLDTSAKILNVPSNQLHFIGGTVGGGFGGKVDSIVEPLAILGAMLTGKPVRHVFDRQEEMQVGPPRGAERWIIKDGVMNDGRIVARQMTGYFDAGAYTRLSSYAVVKCTAHIPGPYTIPNVSSDVYCVFTNRTPATAMRGFGVTGADFSLECQMDKLASLIGMDPVEFRILNAYRDGDMKAHRREAHNCALVECAQVAAEKANWPIRDEFKRMNSYGRDGLATAPQARPMPTKPDPTRPPIGAAPRPRTPPPAPPPPRPSTPSTTQESSSPTTSPQTSPPPETPSQGRLAPGRPGVSRFSRLSGMRRR